MMKENFFKKYSTVWLYGLSLAILLWILRWLELKFLIYEHSFEIYAGIIALFFTGLGIWLSRKLTKPKTETRIIEKMVYRDPSLPFEVNRKEMESLGISERELEVLQLMSQGMSNQEIAAALFVSLNTVKTHAARIFEKLEVQRRTQAVEKAKNCGLIA
jgi:DNA-binding CsgD family transcriptional regulator